MRFRTAEDQEVLSLSIVIWSILVGLGIALHIFVVMMETGATQAGLEKKKIFALGGIFLVVQLCMQSCGILLTWWIKQYLQIDLLERIYKTVYVLLMIWIGYQLFARLRKPDFPDERKSSPLSLKRCAHLSFQTSAEALLLGMTMYYYSSILSFFWVVSLGFMAAVGGFSFGYWNGVRSEKVLCSIDAILLLCLVSRAIFL